MIPALNRHYTDIIDLPRPVSPRRKRMPLSARAAQFAPFAALSGYDGAIQETARLTDRFVEQDEETLDELNRQLGQLMSAIAAQPEVTFTCFAPDEKKAGGAYRSVTGRIRRIDEVARTFILTDGTVLSFDNVHQISCSEQV